MTTAARTTDANGHATEADHILGLLPHHLAELRASGLSDETIKAAGIFSETNPIKLASYLGWGRTFPKRLAPAIVFPFRSPDGPLGYHRAKPDSPRRVGEKIVKYESPLGRPNELYHPPGRAEVVHDATGELLITEGEKKALCATQYGFPCVGLVGCFGWKTKDHERMIPPLQRIKWPGRKVYIVFDSDVAANESNQQAEARLAHHLTNAGAVVRIVRLPAGPPDADGKPTKIGLDDFLVANGSAVLAELIRDAAKAPPPAPVDMRVAARELDPAETVKADLVLTEQDGVPTLRYWRGSYWRWAEGRYVEQADADIRGALVRSLNRRAFHVTTSVANNHMLQLAAQSHLPSRVDAPAWLGGGDGPWPAREVLAARNGICHLPTLASGNMSESLQPPTAKLWCHTALDYDIDPKATMPAAWLEFLRGLWPEDPESVTMLQEWAGYLLSPDTRQQKILMMVGPKRSGKGTVARVLTAMLGRENVVAPTLTSLAGPYGLASWVGKTLAIMADARLSGKSDHAVVVERLLRISGEDAVEVERKHLPSINCTLPTRIMILTNELPRIADASGALASRMLVLHTPTSWYGREDHGLEGRLLAELPSILIWAVIGWARLRGRGHFIPPASGGELAEHLGELASPITSWVGEHCTLDPEHTCSIENLYDDYKHWCTHNGYSWTTKNVWARDLIAAYPRLRRTQATYTNGGRYRGYRGITMHAWVRAKNDKTGRVGVTDVGTV